MKRPMDQIEIDALVAEGIRQDQQTIADLRITVKALEDALAEAHSLNDRLMDRIEALRGAAPMEPQSQPIPEGYALVPLKPTQEMCMAMQEKLREWPRFPFRVSPVYQAALAAAPAPGEKV